MELGSAQCLGSEGVGRAHHWNKNTTGHAGPDAEPAITQTWQLESKNISPVQTGLREGKPFASYNPASGYSASVIFVAGKLKWLNVFGKVWWRSLTQHIPAFGGGAVFVTWFLSTLYKLEYHKLIWNLIFSHLRYKSSVSRSKNMSYSVYYKIIPSPYVRWQGPWVKVTS